MICPSPLHESWTASMKTFQDIAKKYADSQRPEAIMTLQEAIDYIRQHTTPEIRRASEEKVELYLLRNQVQNLRKRYDDLWGQYKEMHHHLLTCYVEKNGEEIGRQISALKRSQELSDRYKQLTDRVRLHNKHRLKNGEITQKEFQNLLTRIRKRQEEYNHEVWDCQNDLVLPLHIKYGLSVNIKEIINSYRQITNQI